MDRRSFLAIGGAAAAFGSSAIRAHETGYPHEHPPGGIRDADGLLMRLIPATGERIPAMGFAASNSIARAALQDSLSTFFNDGASLIATSTASESAERLLGELLTREQQSKAFVATRVSAPLEQIEGSMSRLKRQRLELVLAQNRADVGSQLETLRRLKGAGRIRYVGVSHDQSGSCPDLLALVEHEKLDFVQFHYSAVTREAERRLLPLCADKGVAVIVTQAFDGGALFTQVRGKPVPVWAADFGATSWSQVFLKFVLSHPAVTCVVPGAGTASNLAENLNAAAGGLPNGDQRAQIVAALSS